MSAQYQDRLFMAGAELTADDRSRLARLWLALAVLTAALFANQWTTLRTFKALVLADAPNAPVATLGRSVSRVLLNSWDQLLGPADILAALALLAATVYIVRTELAHGTATRLLAEAERSPRALALLLGLTTLAIARVYLAPGQVFMGDSETHMLRAWMFVEHFRNLDTPTWSNAWYGGFPLLINYAPLYFVTTAIATIGLGDIHTATKLLLWASHVGSVFVMFAYLLTVTGRRLPAVVGALAYALSFHRIHIVLYQGDLQVGPLLLLFPAALLVTERLLRGLVKPRTAFIQLALLLALMILNHQGYAFFGLVFLGIYGLARLAAARWPARHLAAALAVCGLATAAAVVMSAFVLVPSILETGEHRGQETSPFGILIPNPLGPIMLIKLLRWSAVGDGGTLGYLGLSIALMACAGAYFGLRRRDPAVVALAAGAIATLLLVRNNVSYNVKNVDFLVFFASALTGWVVPAAVASASPRLARMRQQWQERFPARVAVLAAGLLLLDLGPTTFQSLFRENYEFKAPMYARVAALAPYKMIERQVLHHDPARAPDAYFDSNKLGIPSAYSRLQTPLGFFHEGAGRSFGYHAELVKQLHRDLNAGILSESTLDGLYVMGVRYVAFRDRYRWFTPSLPPSPSFSTADGLLTLRDATPLLVSRSVVSLGDIPGYPPTDVIRQGLYKEPETFDYSGRYLSTLVRPVMERMRVDRTRAAADTLVSADPAFQVDLAVGEPVAVDVSEFTSDLKRVTVAYRADGEFVAQLPYTYFSYLSVDVDDRPAPFFRSAFNSILLRLPSGDHRITITGVLSPLQSAMAWLSLAALAVVVVVPARFFRSIAFPPAA